MSYGGYSGYGYGGYGSGDPYGQDPYGRVGGGGQYAQQHQLERGGYGYGYGYGYDGRGGASERHGYGDYNGGNARRNDPYGPGGGDPYAQTQYRQSSEAPAPRASVAPAPQRPSTSQYEQPAHAEVYAEDPRNQHVSEQNRPMTAPSSGGRPQYAKAQANFSAFTRDANATMAPAGHVDFAGLAQSAMSRGGLWVDPDFGPDDSSLWIDRPNRDGAIGGICGRQIGWKRITELSPKPELFIDDVEDESGDGGAEANDIMQGTLGDCYFLSSLAILCTSKGHGLVERLFVCQDYLHAGLVGCRFFKEGQWIDVAIDTYLPCDVSRTRPYPVFARNKDPNEFWMALLEKAYAKIHGSYECLDAGFMNESLVDLTGAAPGEVDIPDLFAACGNDKVSALKVLGARTFGTLLQGASNDSGNEEPLGNGLISGHAYSINQVRQISTGDVLVQLRNPWGSHEWEGAWCDSDPCWTPTLKREVGQTDKNDGMFWMSIADFAKCFTRITFCDLVPSTFTVIRAESEWTRTNGGGCPNHKTWNRNPQLLMRVYERSHVTISLNQPDTRLMFRTGELTKADFEELYGSGSGYDEAIGFTVFRGGERKMRYSKSEVIGKADYSSVRTVSTCIPDCPPGDYMVVPSTFDPKMMKFRMRFWSNNPIDLIDTKGGSEWQLYDAGADSVLTQNEPKSMPVEVVPVERVEVPSQQQSTGRLNVMTRVDPLKPQPLNLQEDMTLLAKASWKVGAPIPDVWQHGQDFLMGPENRFQKFEMVAVMRPDRTMRFARVEADYTDGTYDLCTGVTETGQLMFKSNVPANFICKFPHNGPFPVNLVNQIKMIFEVIDLDGSGAIDVDFDANSLGEFNTNMGRRVLRMCEINREDIEATMAALRAIDINGDGKIQQQEFVPWMCQRMIQLAVSVKTY